MTFSQYSYLVKIVHGIFTGYSCSIISHCLVVTEIHGIFMRISHIFHDIMKKALFLI